MEHLSKESETYTNGGRIPIHKLPQTDTKAKQKPIKYDTASQKRTLPPKHIPLQDRQGRIRQMQRMQPDSGNPTKETTNHFIFDCPAHHEARSNLINKIGRTNFNLPEIMSNEKYMKALVTFINRMRRLRR